VRDANSNSIVNPRITVEQDDPQTLSLSESSSEGSDRSTRSLHDPTTPR